MPLGILAAFALSACQSASQIDTPIIPTSTTQKLPSSTLGLIERIGTLTLETPQLPQPYEQVDASRTFNDLGFKTKEHDNGFVVLLTYNGNTIFDPNNAELKPELTEQLKIIATEANKPHLANHSIQVTGHTDMAGSDEVNLQLSESRARNVSQAIEAFGVSEPRLSSIGYGENNPLYFEPSKTKYNRRADLVFLNP